MPAHGGELALFFCVTGLVSLDFLLPEVGVGFGKDEIFAPPVPVPEAAVDEDDCAVFAEDEIGVSREPGMVQTVAEAAAEEELAYQQFGLCVFAFYCRHAAVPLFFCKFVHVRIACPSGDCVFTKVVSS